MTEGGRVAANVRVDSSATASQLLRALRRGERLPQPALLQPERDVQRWQAQHSLAVGLLPPSERAELEARLSKAVLDGPSAHLRERQQWAELRMQVEAAMDAWGSGDGAGGAPALPRGPYAATARQLAAWVAEWLAVQRRNKQEVLKAWYRDPQTTPGGATDSAAEGVVSVAERNNLAVVLDALWGDFLVVSTAC